jgi:hypothetical protein
VRRGAQWALGVGGALIAMAAAGGARADVLFVDLDECSATCIPFATDDAAVAEDASADYITVSLFGGGTEDANNVRPDLILDPTALPPVLVNGLPSPIASAGAQAIDSPGVSPYAFFENIIDVPHSADGSFFLSTPALTSHLSDFLWASYDFFGPPSGDIASRRAIPISADADALYGALTMRNRVMPTLSRPSPLSGPPSSDAAQPFGQVGNKAGRSAEFSSDGADSNK